MADELTDLRRLYGIATQPRPFDGMPNAWAAWRANHRNRMLHYGATEEEAVEAVVREITAMEIGVSLGMVAKPCCISGRLMTGLLRLQSPDFRSWRVSDEGEIAGFKTPGWTAYDTLPKALLATLKLWRKE